MDEPDGFDRAAYLRSFARYPWTYVAGYRELVQRFVLVHGEVFNLTSVHEFFKGWRQPAVNSISPSWKAAVRDHEAYWTTLNPDQIEKACNGSPLRLDRACQAIKALELPYRHSRYPALHDFDFFEVIQLRPAIHTFGEMDSKPKLLLEDGKNDAYERLVDEFVAGRLGPEIRQSACDFLRLVATGARITRANALRVQHHLLEAGCGTVEFSVLTRRGSHKPCKLESAFIKLDEKKMAAAAKLDTAKAAVQERPSRVRK